MQLSNMKETYAQGLEIRVEEEEEQLASGHGSSETFNNTVDSGGDLIVGLPEAVVLMEIIPRISRNLAWDKRPLLNMLNQSWAKFMAEDYPEYDRRFYNRRDSVLSSGNFIISRVYNKRTSLWVWSPFVGELSRLPTSPIPLRKHGVAIYLCDGDRLYALSPTEVREKHHLCHFLFKVWMLSFRDFSVHWKRLPSLPDSASSYWPPYPLGMAGNIGKYVFASTSMGESYIWQRQLLHSSDAGAWKLTASGSGSGEKRNSNSSEWQWESIDVNMRPLKTLNFDNTEEFPSFIEVNKPRDNGDVIKVLYIRHPLRQIHPETISYHLVDDIYYRDDYFPSSIFLSADLDRKSGSGITDGELYCVGLDTAPDGGVCIMKAMADEQKTTTVEDSEWDAFMDGWDAFFANNVRNCPHFNRLDSKPNERSAIKFFGPRYPWIVQHKTKALDRWDDYILNSSSHIDVAYNGPMCSYELYKRTE